MRRKNNITSQYIDTRILQLKEDHDKAKDPHDQKWYNRLIQELEWARLYQVNLKKIALWRFGNDCNSYDGRFIHLGKYRIL